MDDQLNCENLDCIGQLELGQAGNLFSLETSAFETWIRVHKFCQ